MIDENATLKALVRELREAISDMRGLAPRDDPGGLLYIFDKYRDNPVRCEGGGEREQNMRLEEALKQLRKGVTISLRGVAIEPDTDEVTRCHSLFVENLLSEEWEAALTDDQIIEAWENDVMLRVSTGQHAQAALLRDCIKMLRARRL